MSKAGAAGEGIGSVLFALAVMAVVVAVILGFIPNEVGDTYCGAPLRHGSWSGPCGDAVRAQTMLMVGLGGSGVAVLVVLTVLARRELK